MLSKFALIGLSLSVVATAAAASDGDVYVEQAWARATVGKSRPAAAYLTIVNTTTTALRLASIETPLAGHAEAHRTTQDGSLMRMEAATDLEIPAQGRVAFAPGGLHVMLMGLQRPLENGQSFPLTLRFSDGRSVTARVAILPINAKGPER